jgi:hypothetical protein
MDSDQTARRLDDADDTARAAADDISEKVTKKELRRQLEAARPLDSWERYRALNDATDEAYDLIDISNREARFALIVMGGLNALLFVVATRSDLPQQLSQVGRTIFFVAIALYALLAAYFLFQAIELLRPRRFHPPPHLPPATEDDGDAPLGIRYYEDVVERNVDGHLRGVARGAHRAAQRGTGDSAPQPVPHQQGEARCPAPPVWRASRDHAARQSDGGGVCVPGVGVIKAPAG